MFFITDGRFVFGLFHRYTVIEGKEWWMQTASGVFTGDKSVLMMTRSYWLCDAPTRQGSP